jgi:hypothetical protein
VLAYARVQAMKIVITTAETFRKVIQIPCKECHAASGITCNIKNRQEREVCQRRWIDWSNSKTKQASDPMLSDKPYVSYKRDRRSKSL